MKPLLRKPRLTESAMPRSSALFSAGAGMALADDRVARIQHRRVNKLARRAVFAQQRQLVENCGHGSLGGAACAVVDLERDAQAPPPE